MTDDTYSAEARRFEFFRYVSMMQRQFPELPPVGFSKTPDEDLVRFGQKTSMAHEASDIADVSLDSLGDGRQVLRILVNFMGLTGPNGALPLHISELVLKRSAGVARPEWGERANGVDTAMAEFLDVFHHRMISFFFRAWASPRMTAGEGSVHRFRIFLGSLIGEGLSPENFIGEGRVPLDARLSYAGHLAGSGRNAEGLQAILSDFLGVAVTVEEHVGKWVDIPPEDRLMIGKVPGLGLLGVNAIAGDRLWLTHMSIRVKLGPLSLSDYQRLTPEGDLFPKLEQWLRLFCGAELVWDLQLILRREEVPPCQLGGAGVRLGQTSWLSAERPANDPDDYILSAKL